MRRRLVVVGGIAVAVAVGLTLGLWRSGESTYPKKPLTVTPSLSPRTFAFADRLFVRLDVLVDPRSIDPASVRVRPRFGLFRVLAADVRERRAGGALVSYRYTLECIVQGCLPGRTLAERRFLPVLVSYRTLAGRARRA